MTAVEWLYEQMPKKLHPHYKKQLQQAKKMEMEQMIEFAKLHVDAALKAKVKAMKGYQNDGYGIDEIDAFTRNSYPLENIK